VKWPPAWELSVGRQFCNVKKRVSWQACSVENPSVKGRLYACSSYSETVIITVLRSVARKRLVEIVVE
jgi:hypothetical protein